MNEIKPMAEALGQALKSSKTYREYEEFAQKMQKKPALAKRIDDLKQMQASLVFSQSGGAMTLENEKRLCGMYSEISMDEDAIGFWHSERQVLEILQDALETVSKAAPVNLLNHCNEE